MKVTAPMREAGPALTSTLARTRDEEVVSAFGTAGAGKTVGEDAALSLCSNGLCLPAREAESPAD